MEKVDENLAKEAKRANSWSDYREGSTTSGYMAACNEVRKAAEERKARKLACNVRENKELMKIKFYWNGICVDGVLHPCSYSYGMDETRSAVMVYGKHFKRLPDIGWKVKNDSDFMADYHEQDSVYLLPCDRWYQEAYRAWRQSEIKLLNRCIQKIEKKIALERAGPYDKLYLKEYRQRLTNI